jgi:two-component system, NtrC family, response regulator HydG
LESELFGHKTGAFTGADQDRIGIFEHAAGGTLFLDEIGDISPNMQMKLLRVLQEREIVRLGENKRRKIDVRILSATNKDLEKSVQTGRFREDLLYRIRVVEIVIPPLRDRREDIPPLARHFVQRLASQLNRPKLHLDALCLDYLMKHSWPGNVRELENALERAAVLAPGDTILPEFLPPGVLKETLSDAGSSGAWNRSLNEVESEHIRNVLNETGRNQLQAARVLGISPSTLWRKMKTLGSR